MRKQLDMNAQLKHALCEYVIQLVKAGRENIHVSEVIPPAFNQFIDLDGFCRIWLGQHNISYDKRTGWFRHI